MKLVKRILIVALLLGIGMFSFYYWGTYSEGVRAGVVVKISKKGFLFKTYEGQMNLLTFGAIKSQNLINESFEFSVSGDEKEIIKILEEVSLSGERVSLHYVERFAIFPWRGDTKYFIVKIEREGKGQ